MLPLLAGQGKRPELCWRGNLSARDVGVRVRPPPRLPPPFQRQEGTDRQKLKAGPGCFSLRLFGIILGRVTPGKSRSPPGESGDGGVGSEPKAAAPGFFSGLPLRVACVDFQRGVAKEPRRAGKPPLRPPPRHCGARPSQTVNSTSDLRCRRNIDQVGFSLSSVDCEVREKLTASSPK